MNKTRKDKKDDLPVIYEPYMKSVLTTKVLLSITEVGKNIKQNLEKVIVSKTEDRCIVEGYIKPESVNILTYSAGKVHNGHIEFHITYECMVCHPVDGMLIECYCKTITKAGIHAEVVDKNKNIPIIVFIARDHHINNHMFDKVVDNSKLVVRVIGVRFELYDPNICVIGTLKNIVL
uniref:Uncharacterized protein n=1 Tax=viral metagenome TaxID=1070528 RepID=A0A6C0I1I0_9ZZZZ